MYNEPPLFNHFSSSEADRYLSLDKVSVSSNESSWSSIPISSADKNRVRYQ
jgi:hypothetical protein